MSEKAPEDQEEQYIDADQVAELVAEDDNGVAPPDDDDLAEDEMADDEESDGERIEIDMSNNSSSYFDGHDDSIYLISKHPTLPMVVTGGGDNMAYLWTTNRTGEATTVAALTGFTESVISGGFSYDGSYLIAGDMTGQIRIWKSANKGQNWQFFGSLQEVEEIVWITLHPSQNIFAFGAIDGSVWVYQLEPTLSNISVLSGHSQPTNKGIFVNTNDMDNLTLLTISDDSTIVSWNVYTSMANYTLGGSDLHGDHPWISITLSPSSKTAAIGSSDGYLLILGLEKGNVLSLFETFDPKLEEIEARSVEAVAWSTNLPIVVTGNVEGEVRIWDTNTWRVRKALKFADDAITQIDIPKGAPYAFASSMNGKVYKFDLRSGNPLWEGYGHNTGVLGFAVVDNRIATAGDEGVSLVFEHQTENSLTKVSR